MRAVKAGNEDPYGSIVNTRGVELRGANRAGQFRPEAHSLIVNLLAMADDVPSIWCSTA